MVSWQVGGSLFCLAFGVVNILEDYMRVIFKKGGADMLLMGIGEMPVRCFRIGMAVHHFAKALQAVMKENDPFL